MHWDFAMILLFLGTAVPLLGRRRVRKLLEAPHTTKSERLALYASTVVFQWLTVGVILWRTRAHSIAHARLGLAIPKPLMAIVVTIVLAGLLYANQALSLRRISSNAAELRGILPQLALKIFPQDHQERIAFTGLVATVAFCEEMIYRGFAQRVFEDWSRGKAIVGILGSAAIFAFAHLYQGRRGLIVTCVMGAIFSSIRAITGSLLPSAVGHFVADMTAGFLAPSKVRRALSEG